MTAALKGRTPKCGTLRAIQMKPWEREVLIEDMAAALKEVLGADVLYQWANEKHIGAKEWSRRSDVINRVHAALASVAQSKTVAP